MHNIMFYDGFKNKFQINILFKIFVEWPSKFGRTNAKKNN